MSISVQFSHAVFSSLLYSTPKPFVLQNFLLMAEVAQRKISLYSKIGSNMLLYTNTAALVFKKHLMRRNVFSLAVTQLVILYYRLALLPNTCMRTR